MEDLLKLYKKYREVISYLFWGACSTVANIATYWICFEILDIANIPSTIISWVISVAFAYVTNRTFVFESKSKNILLEASKFFGARILTGFFDVGIMFVAVDVMGWTAIVWKIISNVIVIILNYVFSKWFIFVDKTGNAADKTKKAAKADTEV